MSNLLYEYCKDEIDATFERLLEEHIDKIEDKIVSDAMVMGAKLKLLTQIRKKVAKGKTAEQIADELEERLEKIQELMKTLK